MLWLAAGVVVLAPLDGLILTNAGSLIVWRPWRLYAVPWTPEVFLAAWAEQAGL